MTVKECYALLGADYEDVMRRLRKEERVLKFLKKFLEDGSFSRLSQSLAAGDMEEAFRAAHTLKGVSQNLSLGNLYAPADSLSNRLKERKEDGEDVKALFGQVEREYERTVSAVSRL